MILKISRDFSERWVPAANNQQQFEYFNNDTSLGIEGIVVYFKPKGQTEYQTRFYSILSTEKTQDGRVVYVNTKKMLDDLEKDLEEGSELELSHASRIEILDDSDGCACQYRSGMSLYMCYKLSRERGIVYEKGIDAPGHGKGMSDGRSGGDKHYLNVEFRRNVVHQPEALVESKRNVIMYDISGGGGYRRDLADVCQVILSDARYVGFSLYSSRSKLSSCLLHSRAAEGSERRRARRTRGRRISPSPELRLPRITTSSERKEKLVSMDLR